MAVTPRSFPVCWINRRREGLRTSESGRWPRAGSIERSNGCEVERARCCVCVFGRTFALIRSRCRRSNRPRARYWHGSWSRVRDAARYPPRRPWRCTAEQVEPAERRLLVAGRCGGRRQHDQHRACRNAGDRHGWAPPRDRRGLTLPIKTSRQRLQSRQSFGLDVAQVIRSSKTRNRIPAPLRNAARTDRRVAGVTSVAS